MAIITLEKYLEELEKCEDDNRLKTEFGISPNWSIFMNADIERVVNDFCESKNFNLRERKEESYTIPRPFGISGSPEFGKGFSYILDYSPGTVVVNAYPYVCKGYTFGIRKERNRQITEHNMSLILNPYQQPKRIPDVSLDRAIAIVVGDIGDYILRNQITACFPLWCNQDNLPPIYNSLK